ncbi:MAG: hypothetical protein Kow0074_03240 [Candidatus Zixiibacteriota bacterium]
MPPYRRFVTWLAVFAAVMCVGATQATAQTPEIILDIEEEIARPGNSVPLSIYIQNLSDSIAGFQMGITLSRPDLMFFDSDTTVDTCYQCADSACTSLVEFPCTVEVIPIDAEGTLTQSWDYVQARTFGSFDLRITALADNNFDELPGPITPFTNGILIKVIGYIFCDVPDTLQDRTVIATMSPVNTFFSNMQAQHIKPLQLIEGAVTVGFTNCGDMNGDGSRDAVDLNLLIEMLFFNGTAPCPARVSDLTCDGLNDVLDLNWIIDLLFFGGPDCPC